LGQAPHSIRYRDAQIIRRGIIKNDDALLNYYLLRSHVDKERFDTTMTITAFIHQLINVRRQLKDVLRDAKSNGSFYEVEVATTRVEHKYHYLTEDNPLYEIEREEKI
jgi:predicted AlkP superfamily phosphohydrolase/phosphomutase